MMRGGMTEQRCTTAVNDNSHAADMQTARQRGADLGAARDGGAVAHGVRQFLVQQRLQGSQLPPRQLRQPLAHVQQRGRCDNGRVCHQGCSRAVRETRMSMRGRELRQPLAHVQQRRGCASIMASN